MLGHMLNVCLRDVSNIHQNIYISVLIVGQQQQHSQHSNVQSQDQVLPVSARRAVLMWTMGWTVKTHIMMHILTMSPILGPG